MFLAGLAYPSAAAARIPIERFKGAVMLISGADDQLWPSNVYADRIMATLRSDPARHIHLNYPGAGHGVSSFPFAAGDRGARVARFRDRSGRHCGG